jgi:fibronectin type 3 domain-containing protein
VVQISTGLDRRGFGDASARPAAAAAHAPDARRARGDIFSEVELSWTESAGAVKYHVFRSTTPGGPYGRVASTDQRSYTDGPLTAGTTDRFVVTAEDSSGQLSDYSNEGEADSVLRDDVRETFTQAMRC